MRDLDLLCISFDGWDAPNKAYFLAIEIFFLDADWCLRRQLLSLKLTPGARGTAEVQEKHIRGVLVDRGLTQEIEFVTADTTATNPATARLLQAKFVGCIIHTGALVMKHALEDPQVKPLADALAKIEFAANWVLYRKIARRFFKDIQPKGDGARRPLSPVSNFSPRCMVSVDVLERAIKLKAIWEAFPTKWKAKFPRPAPPPGSWVVTAVDEKSRH